MVKIAKVKLVDWDKTFMCETDIGDLKYGDKVLLNIKVGNDLGKVIDVDDKKDEETNDEIVKIIRRATQDDILKLNEQNKHKEESKQFCHDKIRDLSLPMKLIDVHFSYDGRRVTFAFIANGRVDFRELVRILTQHFQKSVRLHQIGVRDEAKINSDVGSCGRTTCCSKFLKVLGNVNADLAEFQQVSHRGSERLSGICGRLHCCLNYEQSLYESLAKDLLPIGTKVVLYDNNQGTVVGWHTLKKTVDVELKDSETFVEVELLKIKKKII